MKYKEKIAELERENGTLRQIISEMHWMARRYADGSMTYATSMHNDNTRILLKLGVPLRCGAEGTLWARDGMGARYSKLSQEEYEQGKGVRSVIPLLKDDQIKALELRIKELQQELERFLND